MTAQAQPTKTPQGQVVNITPESAKMMLEKNTSNRPKSLARINSFAEQMKQGEWALTGESIIIADDGTLLNGQHRLEAVIVAGVAVSFFVIRGINKETFKYMDTGKNRSAGDVLAIAGHANASNLASIAKAIIVYERDRVYFIGKGSHVQDKARMGVTNADILAYVKENERLLRKCLNAADQYRKAFNAISMQKYGLLYYLLGNVDTEDANKFLKKFTSGSNLPENSAILKLRDKFINAQLHHRPYNIKVELGMIFKAWNLFRQGRDRGNINFNMEDDLPTLL